MYKIIIVTIKNRPYIANMRNLNIDQIRKSIVDIKINIFLENYERLKM